MRTAKFLAVLVTGTCLTAQQQAGSAAATTAREGVIRTVPRMHPTIQAAILAASSGDRIVLSPGTYVENIDLLDKRLVIEGASTPEVTRIDGNSSLMPVVRAQTKNTSGTILRNLTLTGGTGLPTAALKATDYYGGGLCAMGGASLRLEDCHLVDNGNKGQGATFGGGVYAGGKGTRVELHGCLVRNNNAWASGGATLADMEATIVHDRCTIVGNNARAWAFGHQGGVSAANGGTALVSNSIVWDNAGFQVRAFGPPYDEGCTIQVTFSTVQYGIEGKGNLLKNPKFVDAEKGNFRLLPDSPCVDTGDPEAPRDADGTPTEQGAFPVEKSLVPRTLQPSRPVDAPAPPTKKG